MCCFGLYLYSFDLVAFRLYVDNRLCHCVRLLGKGNSLRDDGGLDKRLFWGGREFLRGVESSLVIIGVGDMVLWVVSLVIFFW